MASYKLPCKDGEEWRQAKLLNHKTQELEELTDYYVSNKGRMFHKVGNKYKPMKLASTSDGYLTCNIGKARKKVHRIVASTFLEIPDDIEQPVVDHVDGIKDNNDVSDPDNPNLRWVTVKDNTQFAYANGLIKDRKMMKVLVVDKNEDGILYHSQRAAAEATGIDNKLISRVVRGLAKTTGGYKFVRMNNFKDLSNN